MKVSRWSRGRPQGTIALRGKRYSHVWVMISSVLQRPLPGCCSTSGRRRSDPHLQHWRQRRWSRGRWQRRDTPSPGGEEQLASSDPWLFFWMSLHFSFDLWRKVNRPNPPAPKWYQPQTILGILDDALLFLTLSGIPSATGHDRFISHQTNFDLHTQQPIDLHDHCQKYYMTML